VNRLAVFPDRTAHLAQRAAVVADRLRRYSDRREQRQNKCKALETTKNTKTNQKINQENLTSFSGFVFFVVPSALA
jgi:hypothetical protein